MALAGAAAYLLKEKHSPSAKYYHYIHILGLPLCPLRRAARETIKMSEPEKGLHLFTWFSPRLRRGCGLAAKHGLVLASRPQRTAVRGRAPAGSVAMAAMHLFTLEFEQSDIEAAYVADRFARTSGAVIVVSAVNIALHTILTIQARSCS